MSKHFLLEYSFCWRTFCWNSFCFFNNFIAYHYWITNNSCKFSIFAATCCKIQKWPFLHWCSFGFLLSHRHLSLLQFLFKLHFLSNLYSHLHDICLVNVLDFFIPVIILTTGKVKYSVSVGTHTLLDNSSRVLQLPAHLPCVTANRL